MSTRSLSIIELCLSTGRGGLEGYAAALAEDLAARGHQVAVVAHEGSEFAARSRPKPALSLSGSRYWPLAGARRLAKLARRADILHIHRSADLPLAATAKWLAGGHPALVYSRHMAITRDRHASVAHRLMFGQVDALLAITAQVAEAARRKLPLAPERIRHVPPGVEAGGGRINCTDIRPAGIGFVAGCFSRIEPAKGQHELIAAIAKLARQNPDVGAVIAGPVMDAAYAEQLHSRVAAEGLDDHVRFLHAMEDARPAMACCDVLVMPSQSETLGLVLIEAMLQGVPVIATAAGGVLELIANGETGLVYPVGDADELARCLEWLARDEEFRAGLARAGQAMARVRHDHATHLARLETLFRQLRPAPERQSSDT